jgi:nucleotide-binding universal stress UspA family protein
MKKAAKKIPHPIVWAIDPFETKNAHRAPLAKAVKVFSHGLSEQVLPFSVVSPGGLAWPVPVSFPMAQELREFGIRAVRRDLKKLHVRGLQDPLVEVQTSSSRRELVEDVLRYAKAKDAGFIAVNTRRLLSPLPFKVGGFAEALIGRSGLPILAVSPKAQVPKQIKKILFPTDFTPRSRKAFRKTLEIAAKLGAEIVLLTVETPIAAPFSFAEMSLSLPDAWIVEAERARRAGNLSRALQWQKEAAKARVPCTYQNARNGSFVSTGILQAAHRLRADLISMAGYRSAGSPAVLGGTVREVLGSARIPVLEIRAS